MVNTFRLMRHNGLILTGILVFAGLSSFAQRFTDGYIVTSGGDTLRGKIFMRIRHQSLVQVIKLNNNQQEETFVALRHSCCR